MGGGDRRDVQLAVASAQLGRAAMVAGSRRGRAARVTVFVQPPISSSEAKESARLQVMKISCLDEAMWCPV